MAIATDSYITLNDTDKIGLSDTLDNYSIDDIKASGYVGAYDPLRTNCKTAQKKSMWSGMEEQKTPFNPEWTGTPYPWSHKIYAGNGTYTGDVFIAVVWLYRNIPGLTAKVINESNISDYKLVTEMPANKMYYTVPSLYSWNSQVCATSWSEERTYPSSYYAPDTGTLDYHSNYGDAGDISVQVDDIYPYMMFEYDGYLYFQLMTQQVDYYASWMINSETSSDWDITPYDSSALTPFTEDSGISLGTSYNAVSRSGEANSLNGCNFNIIVPYDGSAVWAGPADYSEVYGGCIDSSGKYLPYYCFGGAGSYFSTFRVFATLATKGDSLLYFGNSGVKIIADKPYKPIITDGVVTGITDDMTEPSELDEWDMGTTDHGVSPSGPPAPPTPTDVDDMDIMNTGATGSSGGFTHFYIMSPQDLIDLLSDFYTHADAGESLSNNLVCSYILGIPSSDWAATEDVPVAIHNSAQGTPFVSVDDYKHVTATNNMLVTGTFDVPRRTNTFYDFSPYTTYEVFIPCCGWVRLPDTVAGRTINVYLYLDIASCCVKGQVMISGAGVCAVVNGALGSPIPMAVIESGILRGNNIQAGMGMIGGAIQTGVSAGSGNAMGIGLGAERILTGLVNCSVAGNTNYTEQKGGTGDITQFAMGHQCYMKITHPVIDPVVNEYIFAHTVGYLCNTVGQLSDFHGFTMCSNPHVHISATSTEKEEIKRLLEEGVILP